MGHSFFTTHVDSTLDSGSRAFSDHISADPQSFGLTQQQADEYASLHAVWHAAYLIASVRGTRTIPATTGKNTARAALRAAASSLARIINGTSSVSDGQRLAIGISVRRKNSPKPEPGKPHSQTVTLGALGSLTLTWKCDNPRGSVGTMYQIRRQLNDAGAFEHLGVSGTKSFVDDTIPQGTSTAIYEVQAVRSTKTGAVAQFNVNFGVSASMAELLQTQRMRRAA